MPSTYTAPSCIAARAAWLIAALAILTLAGCATKTTVSSTWLDDSKRGNRYDKVLVVAMAAQGDKRMSFEDEVAFNLKNSGAQAWASSRHMPTTTDINPETIAPIADKVGANVVVVSRVTQMDVSTSESKAYTDVTATRRAGTAFRYDYEEKELPTMVTPQFTIELETDVVDVATGERVYSVVAATSGQESLSDVINVLSNAIAKRLRSDGVIR